MFHLKIPKFRGLIFCMLNRINKGIQNQAELSLKRKAENGVSQIVRKVRDTVCPRSSDPFYIVGYYIKWVTTSWTYSR